MKRYLLSLLALGIAFCTYAQTRADYEATMSKFQTLYNARQYDSICGMFGERISKMMPAEKTKDMLGQLSSKLGKMNTFSFIREEKALNFYKTSFDNAVLTMIITLSGDNKFEAFRFVPYTVDSLPKEKTNFTYQSPAGAIYGTLAMPATDKKVPVVLIIAGSGPTDRNGNQPTLRCNTYKMLADSLLKEGIASLRYDKRGIGESQAAVKSEDEMRFGDMVDDAAGMIKQLKADNRFSKIIIAGHSEGSLIGMIAAGRVPVNGYISLAGAGLTANKLIEKQMEAQMREKIPAARILMDSLLHGYKVSNIDPQLTHLFRPSIQPYLISWYQADPQKEIKKVVAPILILQGTTDIQVDEANAEQLKLAAPKATLKMITGMNHILKQAPADRDLNMATYNNPEIPLCPGLMPAIYQFIQQLK